MAHIPGFHVLLVAVLLKCDGEVQNYIPDLHEYRVSAHTTDYFICKFAWFRPFHFIDHNSFFTENDKN